MDEPSGNKRGQNFQRGRVEAGGPGFILQTFRSIMVGSKKEKNGVGGAHGGKKGGGRSRVLLEGGYSNRMASRSFHRSSTPRKRNSVKNGIG